MVRWVAALLVAATLATPVAAASAAGSGSGPDPVEPVRAALYHALMAEIMTTGVETTTEQARWSIGPVNPYPALEADKVIAACIDWGETSLAAVAWHGYAYFYDRTQSRPLDDPARLAQLEARARDHCRQYEATADCFCYMVDRNGRNALRLPEWFVEANLPGRARR